MRSWQKALALALAIVGIYFRWFELDHIPGINGDEAWGATHLRLFFLGFPFRWFTPSHRPICISYFALVYFFQRGMEPSGLALRLPAFLSGLCAVVLAWPLLNRALPEPEHERKSATLAALWIACLPLLIAYSRVGWEPAQVPLASLLVVYFSLRGKKLATALSLLGAIQVHSVNILLLPIAVAPLAYDVWKDPSKRPSRGQWGLAAVASLLLLTGFWRSLPKIQFPGFPTVSELLLFWKGSSRIFSGVLAYAGFSEEPSPFWLGVLDICFGVFLPAFAVLRLKSLPARHRAYAGGVGLSFLALLAVGGPVPVEYGYERYSLFLAIPTLVLLALLWPKTPRSYAVAYGCAGLMLASFWIFYFQPVFKSGGNRTVIYRGGGPVDPKIAASQWVLHDAPASTPLIIAAEDWWLYWVVYNIALGDPQHPVTIRDSAEFRSEGELSAFLKPDGYSVGFSGGPLEQKIQRLRAQGRTFREVSFTDYGGKPLVKVWASSSDPALHP